MHDQPLQLATLPGDREGTTILRLTGPLTLYNLFGFQDEFRAFTPPRLIVDMTDVPYIDSAGLGLLINGHVSAERSGRRLMLVCVTPRVQALMESTRVHTVITMHPSIEAAERSA